MIALLVMLDRDVKPVFVNRFKPVTIQTGLNIDKTNFLSKSDPLKESRINSEPFQSRFKTG